MSNPSSFLRFHFTSTSPHNGVVIEESGLFFDRASFDAHLARWNRQGWTYEETAADALKNAAPECVRGYESECLAIRSVQVWTGPAAHHHGYIVPAEDAMELARDLKCSVTEAARLRSRDLLALL